MFLPPYTLNERFYLLRYFSGISQQELAKQLGGTQGWISKVESGRGEITANHLQSIKTWLGITADAFLEGNLPYLDILKKCNNTGLSSKLFQESHTSKVRLLYGPLAFLKDTIGLKSSLSILKTIGFPVEHLAEPRLPISLSLFTEIFSQAEKMNRVWTSDSFKKLALHTLSEDLVGPKFQDLKGSKSTFDAFDRFSKLASIYTNDLVFKSTELSAKALSIEVSHVRYPSYETQKRPEVRRLMNLYVESILERVGNQFGHKPVKLRLASVASATSAPGKVTYHVNWT